MSEISALPSPAGAGLPGEPRPDGRVPVTLRTTALGAITVHVPLERVAEFTETARLAELYADREHSANTLLAYGSAWRQYEAWCTSMGFEPLSGDPLLVRMYLVHAAETRTLKTLRLHLSAIVAAHRIVGINLDPRHQLLTRTLKGLAREKGSKPTRQAAPVLPEILCAMMKAMPESALGIRDKAILLLGFGAGLRRSELVALCLDDVEITDRGVLLNIRNSKTDQFGEGEEVAVLASSSKLLCPKRALEAWLTIRSETPGFLFAQMTHTGTLRPLKDKDGKDRGLAPIAIARIVKDAVGRAGYAPEKFAGHSLRSGMATTAAERGASLHDIMRQGRWVKAETAQGYIRSADLWRNNVSSLTLAGDDEEAEGGL